MKLGALTALLEELAVAPEVQRESAREPPLRPGDVVGRFELLRELGRGGFGVVWEARDRELGRSVAFKLVRAGRAEAGVDQLHREAEAVARLQHPNLVTLHDVGRCEHGPYLVLELLRGETLQARLARGPLPLGEALAVAVEVARGLAHAHAEGVVHRDLKPSNVFLCERGGVKLLDFGMAHAFGRKRVSGGTPAYMAPEQWRDAPEDERTDVFALGVMLYQMLTGALPFPDDGGRSVREPEPAPELQVPDAFALGPLVAKMLAKDPAERTRDGGAALAELKRIAAELPSDGPVAAAPMAVGRPRRRRGRVAAAIAAAAAIALGAAALILVRRPPAPSGPPSIAVLPFADMSPQHDQEYFSDGMAEEILNALAHVDGLRVIGRTSSFSFKGRNDDLASIARKLAVGAILEGSVRKEANRVRVTAQLIDAADGSHLWSEAYDRELTSIFRVQEEIAQSVVAALRLKLLPGQAPTTRAAQTASTAAYTLVLRSRHVFAALNKDGYFKSHALLEQAAALDPAYATPHADMALTLRMMATFAGSPAEAEALRRRALAEAERSVALGPELDDAYSIRGLLRIVYQHDWAGAEADLRRSLALTPSHPGSLRRLGLLQAFLGRIDEGIVTVQRSTELDPLRASTWNWLGILQAAAGRAEAARASLARARELAPDSPEPRDSLALLELQAGNPAAALALVPSLNEDDALQITSMAEHDLGHDDASRRALERLIERHGHSDAQGVAEAYAWRGEADPAFQWLDRALGQELYGLKYSPILRRLRGDPRYTALLRKMNLPVD